LLAVVEYVGGPPAAGDVWESGIGLLNSIRVTIAEVLCESESRMRHKQNRREQTRPN
jgi:hypothetical protein